MKSSAINLRNAALSMLAVCMSVPVFAADAESDDSQSAKFSNFKSTPENLVISGAGIYTRSGKNLQSLSGRTLSSDGDQLIDADVNPFYNNFYTAPTATSTSPRACSNGRRRASSRPWSSSRPA